jgi:aspartate/methionine/tyrosine aminotransferase
MAGWRVGYAAAPAQLREALAKVQDTVLICPPRLQQEAALAALQVDAAWLASRVAVLRERRRQLFDAVAAARQQGLAVDLSPPPDGAFYGLLRFPSVRSGPELVERLVREHGVAALPGESFGLPAPERTGVGFLRLSYGMLPAPQLDEALGRLLRGLQVLLPAT